MNGRKPANDRPTGRTATELLATTLPEPRWIIQDYLSEGFGIMVSRPKVGKSWMQLQ